MSCQQYHSGWNGGERRQEGKRGRKKESVLLRIDLEPDAMLLVRSLDILIHPGWAEPVLHALVLGILIVPVGRPVRNLQVHGLVFFVVRAGPAHAGRDVEADLVVWFGVVDLAAFGRELGGCVVAWLLVFERPGRFAAEEVCFEAGVHDAAVEAEGGMEGRTHVADFFQFAPDGTGPQRVFVVEEEYGGAVWIGRQGGICSLCG